MDSRSCTGNRESWPQKFIRRIRIFSHRRLYASFYRRADVILYGVPRLSAPGNISVAGTLRLNEGALISAEGHVSIGKNVTISTGAALISNSYDTSSWKSVRDKVHQGAPISIGDNVWIAARAIILPGVSIASNCIVGAGSVVTRSFPDEFCVIAGNPARVVKHIPRDSAPGEIGCSNA